MGWIGILFVLFFMVFMARIIFMIVASSAGAFGVIGTIITRQLRDAAARNAANDASPVLEAYAKVVAKRTRVSGMESSSTHYYATFEFTDGSRTEFSVQGQEYGMIAEGDRGTLRTQGTRYLGFSREVTAV